jgi:hypothetical protein
MMIQRKDLDARIDTQNRVSIYICVHGI